MEAEGWYRDPYGLDDARWISDGEPTSLVRDNGVESRDEPPPLAIIQALVEASDVEAQQGEGDARRADDAANGRNAFSRKALVDAVWDDADAHLGVSGLPI